MKDLPDYSDRRFLVVDDEEFMRTVVMQVLRQLSVENIVTAADGSSALTKASVENRPFDCVVCDFNMKPVNGLMLLKAIRLGKAQAFPREQAFIMLTGHGETEIVKIAAQLDVNGYLVKPVSTEKLVSVLERVFTKEITPKSPEDYSKVSLGGAELDESGKLVKG